MCGVRTVERYEQICELMFLDSLLGNLRKRLGFYSFVFSGCLEVFESALVLD